MTIWGIRISAFQLGLAVSIVVYGIVTGGLIMAADFLPYVMDNNESFSTLWHAANIHHFGIAESWGLADESFSPHGAAHPFVHTHQGNWPRLFGWLIYELGARDIQSQIAVTTAIVGIAGIAVLYATVARATNPLFGTVAAMIFATDYLLFSQWQVVTYRVWYGLLFFLPLLAVHRVSQQRRWLAAVAAAMFALAYFELVFATFTGLMLAFYSAVALRRHPRLLAQLWAAAALGSLAAISLLLLQLVGYMGIEGALKDLTYTFVARNHMTPDSPEALAMDEFYRSHNVAFWRNFADWKSLGSLHQFLWSIFSFDFLAHTPFVTGLALIIGLPPLLHTGAVTPGRPAPRALALALHGIVIAAAMAGMALIAFGHRPAGALALGAAAILGWVCLRSPALAANRAAAVQATKCRFLAAPLNAALPMLAFSALWLVSGNDKAVMGSPPSLSFPPMTVIMALAVGGACTLLLRRYGGARPLPATAIGLLAAALLAAQHRLYEQDYAPLWTVLLGSVEHPLPYRLAIMAAGLFAATICLRNDILSRERTTLAWLRLFLLSGGIAYGIVYVAAAGYIRTGYLERAAPFTVFITDMLMAFALYLPLAALRAGGRAVPALAAAAFACLTAGWVCVQANTVVQLPPTHYAFLPKLAKAPYVGASAAVGNYAAPIAAFTGNWAYYDPMLGAGKLDSDGRPERYLGYLWLADAATNPAYAKPDLYICMVPQKPSTMAKRAAGLGGDGGCETLALNTLAPNASFSAVVVDSDPGAKARGGMSYWAVLRLTWK